VPLPEFIQHVEAGLQQLPSGNWLTPATVDGLTENDFVTLPPGQRRELYRAVEQFRTSASAPDGGASQATAARAALDTIATILRPYLTPESRRVREVIWTVWREEDVRDWIPTFDYQLDEDWTGAPAIRVLLILKDDVEIEAPGTVEVLGRFRMLSGNRPRSALLRRNFDVRPRSFRCRGKEVA